MRPPPPWPTRRAVVLSLALVVVLAACSSPAPAVKPVASADGWARVVVGSRPAEQTATVESMERVTVSGTGVWLALGSASSAPGQLVKPGAWASQDNSTWSAIGMPVGPDETGSVETAASDGPLGLVGGRVGSGPSAVPAVWHATGSPWSWEGPTRLPVPPDAHGAVVRSIAKGPRGWVAVGGAVDGGDAPPLLWWSTDGASWSLADVAALPRDHAVWSVASSSDRFVAVASTNGPDGGGPRAAVTFLASDDGRSWQPQALQGLEQPVVSRTVRRVRDWFVAAIDCCDAAAHRLAVSRDGRTWSPGLTLADHGSGSTTLAERDGRLVAWGGSGTSFWADETSPTQDLGDATTPSEQVWQSVKLPPTPDHATGEPQLAAAGTAMVLDWPAPTKANLYWTFGDGTWGNAVSDVPPPAHQSTETVRALAGGGQVVVGVGDAAYEPLRGRKARDDEGRIWVSSGDLVAWSEVILSSNITRLTGVATDGTRFVAVGQKADGPAVLVSNGGAVWREITSSDVADVLRDLGVNPDDTSTTTGGSPDEQRLLDGEIPETIVRFADRYVLRTSKGNLWSSAVGARWERADLPAAAADQPALADALCSPSDVLLAPPYRSSDGMRWSVDPRTKPRPTFGNGFGCAGGPSASGLIAGPISDVAPTTFLTLLTGDRADESTLERGYGAAVARDGDQWLLLGRSTQSRPGAWSSTDARDWHALDGPMALVSDGDAGFLTSALRWQGKLMLAGRHNGAALALVQAA